MKNRAICATLLGACLMGGVAGCITVSPPEPEVAAPPRAAPPPAPPVEVVREKIITTPTVSDSDRLLSYYAYVATLSKDQSAKEVEQARRFHESTSGSFARMKWVLARLAHGNELRDPDKTLELLGGQLSSKDDTAPELRALAALLKQVLGDNRALEISLESQKEKHKEEIKKSEALRQKLDAIIEAERKLLERNRPK